ncbi:MAG: phosphate ABC transporter substrate-binding protein [Spirochaetia bacterium]|jgi:phosphate transport system substrate-binding protein
MKKIVGICMFLFFVEAVGFGQAGLRGGAILGGSTTIDPIIQAAIESFTRIHPDVKLTYEGENSQVGISRVLSGEYPLAGVSRNLTGEEKAKGLIEHLVALDGVAVIVNKGLPMQNLSRRQLANILNGIAKNWRDLGGPDGPILVVSREEVSGTRITLEELVLQKEYPKDSDPRAGFLSDASTATSNGDMVEKVGSTRGSIGFCGLGYLAEAEKAGARAVSIDKVTVSSDSVISHSYPISRRLYMVSKGALRVGTLEEAFVDFLLSPEGQSIVKAEGYVPLPIK